MSYAAEVVRLEGDGAETVTHELRAGQDCAVAFQEGVFFARVMNLTVPASGGRASVVNVGRAGLSLQERPAGARVSCAWYAELDADVADDDNTPPSFVLGHVDPETGKQLN